VLATEYAYRHRSQFDTVWWVRAEQPATLVGDYAGLAGALQLLHGVACDLPECPGPRHHRLHAMAPGLVGQTIEQASGHPRMRAMGTSAKTRATHPTSRDG
jgi:hypothetical protein